MEKIRFNKFTSRIGDNSIIVRLIKLSDVVLVDDMVKCNYAVGVMYDARFDKKPHLTYVAKGEEARRMIRLAKVNGIEVQLIPRLVQGIVSKTNCEIGGEIPREFYRIVAYVLSTVHIKELKKHKLL